MAYTSRAWVRFVYLYFGKGLTIFAEGDVDGIMERPEGSGEEVHRAREKWYVVLHATLEIQILRRY
jgi:hypothetical protein